MRAAGFDRDEVVEKITDAFWENGYEATSIGVLETATGLKRQSLYNAFGNKDSMFEMALDHYHRRVSERIITALDNPDPREALRDFFDAQAKILLDQARPSGCLVAGGQQELANRNAPLGDVMSGLLREQHDALVKAFERWKEDGRLSKESDAESLAAVIMAMLRGQAVIGRSGEAAELVERAARTMPELLERYLV